MHVAKNTRSGLGRGLNSLLGGYYDEPAIEKPKKVEEPKPEKNPEPTPSANRVVVESSDLQEIMNSEMASNRSVTPQAKPPKVVMPQRAEPPAPSVNYQQVEKTPVVEPTVLDNAEDVKEKIASKEVDEVPLNDIEPNPDQPRTNFKQEEVEELASSIEKDGLLQPIVVRPLGSGKYQIIAGERRWQACRFLKMEKVPVRIREADEDKALELALIENIQRSDLNPIEEAYGYKRLMERMNLTQSEVAQVVSKGRSTIANALRLLELPEEAQQLLFEEKITAGHARAILSIPSAEGRKKLTEKLVTEKLTVRETEALARLMAGKKGASETTKRAPTPASFKKVAKTLRDVLHTNVRVKTVQGKNKIEIEFKDEEELHRLFEEIIAAEKDSE